MSSSDLHGTPVTELGRHSTKKSIQTLCLNTSPSPNKPIRNILLEPVLGACIPESSEGDGIISTI
jgi:hypothetical protein